MYKRKILVNQKGVSPILETLVAVGISIALLVIFFVSTTNIFTAHDKPNVDVKAKCVGITETLISSPGSASGYDYEWQDKPDNVDFSGLATTELIAYGKVTIKDDEVTIRNYTTMDSGIGISLTCFLSGTKIVLSDGTYKNIEDIKTGDLVKSYNEKTGKITNQKVTKIFHHNPEEMGEYYLVINNQLRVTPNHEFYSNGKWIYADNLKIGDPLFYASKSQSIYYIEKIYKQESTYNFEVEGNHNYFVALDKSDMLVHNAGTTPVPPLGYPTASFNWFDSDGPYSPNTRIFLNADSSNPGGAPITAYDWYFNWSIEEDGIPTGSPQKSGCYVEWRFGNNLTHYVTLKATNFYGSNYYTTIVQANQPEPYIIEQKPWVLTGKDVYPSFDDNALVSYGSNYYIRYRQIAVEPDNYIFEIKKKTKPSYTILDLEKIEKLYDIVYYDVKSALGLNTTNYQLYNFNITLVTEGEVYYYGATFNYTEILESVKKEVLVYYKPSYESGNIIEPCYKKGDITVRVFVGGEVPNYPPRKPRNEIPLNNSVNVYWNVNLSWLGGDVNMDPVTYDIFFRKDVPPSESNPLPIVKSNQSNSTFYPGSLYPPTNLLTPNSYYYWRIKAWDNHDTFKLGPWWKFKTSANNPPNASTNPNPTNNSKDISVTNVNLTWTCTDPDTIMGDKLTYNVRLGTTLVKPLYTISPANWNKTYWDPKLNLSIGGTNLPRLNYNKTYIWRINAYDLNSTSRVGPRWNFTTAKKGLDQYSSYGATDGKDTCPGGVGQTFIAGRDGNLTSINISIKTVLIVTPPPPPPHEDILVEIYECDDPNRIIPEALDPIARGNITSFLKDSYVWKDVKFEESVQVKNKTFYFVLIKTEKDVYNVRYSQSRGGGKVVGIEELNNPYEPGDAWGHNGKEYEKLGKDLTFATYVFRPFMLDQVCNEDEGGELNCSNGLAQTFIPAISGDLMKINLSLINKHTTNQDDITVKIYLGNPEEAKAILATTTIKGFPKTGEFVWKQANFTSNPPYLYETEIYSIVVTTGTTRGYWWEIAGGEYAEGDAWIYDAGRWGKINPDLTFETYMDYIDT